VNDIRISDHKSRSLGHTKLRHRILYNWRLESQKKFKFVVWIPCGTCKWQWLCNAKCNLRPTNSTVNNLLTAQLFCRHMLLLWIVFCVIVLLGISFICCESGNKPCYWCISWPCIQWQPGDSAGVIRCYSGRLFPAACCARVIAREVSACDMGLTHCMGESWPIRGD